MAIFWELKTVGNEGRRKKNLVTSGGRQKEPAGCHVTRRNLCVCVDLFLVDDTHTKESGDGGIGQLQDHHPVLVGKATASTRQAAHSAGTQSLLALLLLLHLLDTKGSRSSSRLDLGCDRPGDGLATSSVLVASAVVVPLSLL